MSGGAVRTPTAPPRATELNVLLNRYDRRGPYTRAITCVHLYGAGRDTGDRCLFVVDSTGKNGNDRPAFGVGVDELSATEKRARAVGNRNHVALLVPERNRDDALLSDRKGQLRRRDGHPRKFGRSTGAFAAAVVRTAGERSA